MNTASVSTNGKGSVSTAPQYALVPMSHIAPGENFSRGDQKESEVKELMGSIAAHANAVGSADMADGLLQPVGVFETSPGKYKLEFGFKRFAAMKALGAKHIPAMVRTGSDGAVRNLAENTVRTDPNMYRVSKQLYAMVEPHVDETTGETIAPTYDRKEAAALVGFNITHVNNLVRLQKKLSPEILAYWEKDAAKGGLLPVRMLISFSALPDHADQNKAFEEWVGAEKRKASEKGEDDEEGGGRKGKKKAPKRPSKKLIMAAIEEEREGSGKRIALEWVMGLRRKLES